MTETTLQATQPQTPLRERIAAILAREPWQMTPMIARQLNVGEADVLRNYPGEAVWELDPARIADLIQEFEALGRVHVICTNGDCVLESYGYFGGFSFAMGYLNVQTPTLDMHIHHLRIKSAFAMIKPSHMDGQKTHSFQFFNQDGRSVFKVFVYKSVSEADGGEIQSRLTAWSDLRDRYLLPAD